MKASPLVGTGLVLALAASLAAAPGESSWRMKADYVEACSCHLFCQCYFNKHAEHPVCEFNMAVTVREGHSGNVDLANTKYWLTGDIGDRWGTEKKATWVTVSFDPKTTPAQREALAPISPKTGLHDRQEPTLLGLQRCKAEPKQESASKTTVCKRKEPASDLVGGHFFTWACLKPPAFREFAGILRRFGRFLTRGRKKWGCSEIFENLAAYGMWEAYIWAQKSRRSGRKGARNC